MARRDSRLRPIECFKALKGVEAGDVRQIDVAEAVYTAYLEGRMDLSTLCWITGRAISNGLLRTGRGGRDKAGKAYFIT